MVTYERRFELFEFARVTTVSACTFRVKLCNTDVDVVGYQAVEGTVRDNEGTLFTPYQLQLSVCIVELAPCTIPCRDDTTNTTTSALLAMARKVVLTGTSCSV